MSLIPIYYDTETTGVSAEKDRIIELAAYNPLTEQTFCEFIQPGIPIPPEASAVHHITDDMVANSPSFAEVGKAFAAFCGPQAVLIAHNNDAFDKLFLEAEFKRNNMVIPTWKYIDSLKWARKYRGDLPRHPLQFLREVYGIAANQAHRALDDVIVLHKIFSQMIDDLSIETVLELLSIPVQVTKMPFGKHQGKPLSAVPKDYVQWLQKNGALDKAENKELAEQFSKLGLIAVS
ncbi:MAG: DNA polymerase III subunit epsilon [Chlamydiae bacterium]|nr:DNA polymerase III subunit epsilon [Chlamydiota bacterium]